jgi:hypothetical protein
MKIDIVDADDIRANGYRVGLRFSFFILRKQGNRA